MASSSIGANLDLRQESGRAAFDCLRRELDESTAPLGEAAAQDLLAIAATFDTAAARLKRELLARPLCPTEPEERLMAWIGLQHRELHQMACAVAFALRAQGSALLPGAIASALHHRGQAAKWSFGAERLESAPLHELMSVAALRRRHREPIVCKVDGGGRRTSIEALYFRALLLERFASGCLTPAQIEILDAWLWEWNEALAGDREPPAAPFLRVDLDSDSGLREGPRAGAGPSLYLRLDTLEGMRRAVAAQMQRGRLVPSSGCASEMPIEDHLAVLDHLEVAFGARARGAPKRAPRRGASAPRVEAWLGLAEIMRRGIGAGIETGRFSRLAAEHPAIASEPLVRYPQSLRRYFWLHDESETGLGFEALAEDASGAAIGDLLGWRRIPGGPVAIGRIMRRLPRAGGEFFFGVRLLSDLAQPLKLRDLADPDGTPQDHLFIPGVDASGRDDAFLLPEGRFDSARALATSVAGQQFVLRFNRVRLRGRGWLLAGFELVTDAPAPVRELSVAPGQAAGAAKPAAARDEIDDPRQDEVRRKLLD